MHKKHSTFFAKMLEEVGLSSEPEHYFDLVPWQVQLCCWTFQTYMQADLHVACVCSKRLDARSKIGMKDCCRITYHFDCWNQRGNCDRRYTLHKFRLTCFLQVLASINHTFLLTDRRRYYLRYLGGLTFFEARAKFSHQKVC